MTAIVVEVKRLASAAPVAWAWRLFMVAALLAVAAPPLIVRMPPLLDYPNHYVRIWLLSGGLDVEPFSRIYALDWRAAWTNLGIDVLARVAGPVVGVHALAPLLLAAAVVLPPLGAMLLHARLYPGRRLWRIGIPLAAWATTLLAGFLNYQIGIGLALAAAAADLWLARRLTPSQLLIVRILVATALLVVHIFALGFYGVLLAACAVGPSLSVLREREGARRVGLRLLAAAATVATPLVAYALTAPALPGHGALAPVWGPQTWRYKLDVLLCAFGTYDLGVDTLFFGVLAAFAAAAALRRSLEVHHGLALGALAVAVVAVVSPTWAADTGWIDTRLPIMALLMLLAGLNPRLSERGWPAATVATVLLALVAVRAGWIGHIWQARQSDVRSIERALAEASPGAAILPVEHRPSIRGRDGAPVGRYFHMGASFFHQYTLSEIDRRAFSPLVFTEVGKQPLKVRPPWDEIAVPNGGRAPTFAALRSPTEAWRRTAPYIDHWRERFDYALMLNADVLEDVDDEPAPRGMTLVADQGFARLYRIQRPAVAAAAALKRDRRP